MLLKEFMNLARSDDRRPSCVRLHYIMCDLMHLEDRRKQRFEVTIIRLLLKAQRFNVVVGLSELVY